MIDTTLTEAMQKAGLSGLVAMAATAEGVIHQVALGNRVPGVAMTLDSVSRIASMTKAITSAAALRLVAQGRLTLDAPVADLVPEVAAPQILSGFAGDTPILRPATTPITLRHLLTHSAGFGYEGWNTDLQRHARLHGLPRIPASPDDLRQVPLLFEPGTSWKYGINLEVAGLAMERATGRSLADLIAEEITVPLGMHDTSFLPGPAHQARTMALHRREPEGHIVPMDMAFPHALPFVYGGGGMFSTALDYILFLQAVMKGTLLPPALQAEFIRPQLPANPVVGQLISNDPRSCDFNPHPGQATSWSLGFLVNTQPTQSGRSPFSLAWGGIFNTYYWIDLTRGICGVVMTQLAPFADPGVLDVVAAYETAVNAST